jgi:putative DNA primase/helicase
VVRNTAARFAGCPVGVGRDEKPLKINVADVRGAEAIARDELASRSGAPSFREAAPGMAFRNGFVVVRDGAIAVLEHSPDHRARHCYPFDYTPWSPSSTPLLCEFLAELFADCAEGEAAARSALLQQFVGACLAGEGVRYQRCLILFGDGGNGKSAMLELARGLFPADAVASVPPQKWSERFSVAALEGKRANFVDETPSAELLDGGAFKAVVTGGTLTAEKKHKDPFDFRPLAGHVFSTNWPLSTTDHSDGFWRRPVIVPFTRRFDLAVERRLDPAHEVLAAELPGAVAWALEGAAQAQRQRGLTLPDQSAALLAEWRDGSDNVRQYLNERPAKDSVWAADFYRQYRHWCTENGNKALSAHSFGRRVMASGLYARRDERQGRLYERR